MPKIFFTERDIEEMAARGEMFLEVSDEVVLTELAYEKAQCLGVRLHQTNSLPSAAPIRPYLAQAVNPCPECSTSQKPAEAELRKRIRDAVAARLGTQVDPALLETIITRVLNNVGMK